MITQDYLKSILNYDPETGDFTWLETRNQMAKKGSVAGYIELSTKGKKYRRIIIDRKKYIAHNLAVFYMTGSWPEKKVVHRDSDGVNNIWDNLLAIEHNDVLTQEYLKELLSYNKESGDFIWLVPYGPMVKKGDVAGTIKDGGSGKKYLTIRINRRGYSAHRLACFYVNGEWPENEVDHQDGNGLHNWWDNLELATHTENQRNRRLNKNNKSDVCGVHFEKSRNKWVASIRGNDRQIKLGRHKDKFEAICMRKSAENKFNYHENHGQVRPL